MFERYTEKARRAIFFARYEASSFGLPYIDANCLQLGLVRENGEISTRWLALDATELYSLVESQTMKSKPVASSVDMPLNNELKRVLAHAAEEAELIATSTPSISSLACSASRIRLRRKGSWNGI